MRPSIDLKIIFLDFTGTIDMVPGDIPTRYEKRKAILPKKESKYKFKKFKDSKDNDNGFYSNVIDTYDDPYTSRFGFGYENEDYGVDAHPYEVAAGYYKSFPVYDSPNKECLKLLKQLLDKTGAKIVYSSTRRWDGWERCADFLGLDYKYSLGHPIFGVTPELPMEPITDIHTAGKGRSLIYTPNNDKDGVITYSYKEREKEIKEWFKQWPGKPIQNYVILDDDPINDKDMKLHWIPSIEKNGFREMEYKQALRILEK